VTAGTGCACTPFIARYAALLAARDHVTVSPANLGVAGLTTATLSAQLADRIVRQRVASAELVVVTIGANDLSPLVPAWSTHTCPASCVEPVVAAMGGGLAQDLELLQSLRRPGARVLVTTYWNVFEDGDVAEQLRGPGFARWSDEVTKEANVTICGAARRAGDRCVDLYQPFEGADGGADPTSLLADDGDHPNAAGHDLIARTLLEATPAEPGDARPTGRAPGSGS
jgi:lysophospholipase L1-like esterase